MAKDKEIETVEKTVEEQKVEENKKEEKVQAKTVCLLKSKANYIIEIKDGNQTKFIQPFGQTKVTKEQLQFVNDADAHLVAFAKA